MCPYSFEVEIALGLGPRRVVATHGGHVMLECENQCQYAAAEPNHGRPATHENSRLACRFRRGGVNSFTILAPSIFACPYTPKREVVYSK